MKITVLEHLRACAEAAKIFTNGLVGTLAQTTADALEEMDTRINTLDEKVGGFYYSEEMLTVPAAYAVLNETLIF